MKFWYMKDITLLNTIIKVKNSMSTPFTFKLADLVQKFRVKVLEKWSVSLRNCLEKWLVSLRNGLEKWLVSLRNRHYWIWLTISQGHYGDSLTISQSRYGDSLTISHSHYGDSLTISQGPLLWYFQLNQLIWMWRGLKLNFFPSVWCSGGWYLSYIKIFI